jgi:hypothetical protein
MIAQNEEGLQQWQNTNLDAIKHQKAICLLVTGVPIKDICKDLGISLRTLERWFTNPEFNQNLSRAIRHVYISCFAKAATNVDRSLAVLMEIIDNPDTPTKFRLDAIKLMLDFTAKGYTEIFKNIEEEPPEFVNNIRKEVKLLINGTSMTNAATSYPKPMAEAIISKVSRSVWEELYPGEEYPEEDEGLKVSRRVEDQAAPYIAQGRLKLTQEYQALKALLEVHVANVSENEAGSEPKNILVLR